MSAAAELSPSMLDRIRNDLVGLKMPRALEALDHTALGICGGSAADRFLVTSLSALEEGDPFEVPWLNAAGEPVQLAV